MRKRLPLAVSAAVLAASAVLAAPTGAAAAPEPATITAYVTGYSYWDNTPPGSAAISHPVIHSRAGGTGTYDDPVTVAVGHSIEGGKQTLDWPRGTRFYIPNLQRYFIVEDTCGDGNTPQNGPCHTGYPSGTSTWLDVYVDGANASSSQSDACMSRITGRSTVVVNPDQGYKVSAGPISDGTCAVFGNTPVRTAASAPGPTPTPTPSSTRTPSVSPSPSPTATSSSIRTPVPRPTGTPTSTASSSTRSDWRSSRDSWRDRRSSRYYR